MAISRPAVAVRTWRERFVKHRLDGLDDEPRCGAPRKIGDDAIAVLQAHDWPGNVRQLRNNVERLMILSEGGPDTVITADLLPEEIGSSVPFSANGGSEHLMSLPLRSIMG